MGLLVRALQCAYGCTAGATCGGASTAGTEAACLDGTGTCDQVSFGWRECS
jgi:hypothetical protein